MAICSGWAAAECPAAMLAGGSETAEQLPGQQICGDLRLWQQWTLGLHDKDGKWKEMIGWACV